MKKKKKYRTRLVLIVILIIALIIGIIAVRKHPRAEVPELENVTGEEEEEIVTASSDEVQNEEAVQEEQPQEEPQEEPKVETPKVEEPPKEITPKTENKNPYYIKINYTQNVVTIYGKDDKGNYTKPIKAMVCSTGSATPTSGTYKMSYKYRWLALYGGVYGQYCTRIVGHILFHSVPYLENGNQGSLEYWEYDKLGTSASAGCIRLTVQDAKWIYDNCKSGTEVEFYSDSNPGPLGKPTAQKISGDETVRGWDPTDPDAKNPWKNYTRPTEKIPEPTTQNTPEQKTELGEPPDKQEEKTKVDEPPVTQEKPATSTEPKEPENPTETEEPTETENPKGNNTVNIKKGTN